jgi:hypothetical protein
MPLTSDIPTVHINASCHCGLFNTTLSLPITHFPLKSAICHCNSCRRATGQLFATFAVIPLPLPVEGSGFDQLVRYDSSKGVARYFCPKCGASVLNYETIEWEFATGVLDFLTEGGGNAHELLEGGLLSRAVLFVGDTKDGGAVPWINRGRREGLNCRKMGHRDSQDVTDGMLIAMNQYSKQKATQKGSKLEGRCHCGDVKIELVSLEGKERYGASLCACTSCRKACGFEFTSWAKLPRDSLKMADGRSLDEGLRSIGSYSTTEEVERHFCKNCGATVSYYRKGMDTIDIAPGLFDAPEGSRSEHWLQWNQDGDNLSYIEDVMDMEFGKKLAHGVQQKTNQLV